MSDEEVMHRPEQSPNGLRKALAALDPDRVHELAETLDAAVAEALEQDSVTPLRAWLLIWARDIEIARRPDLAGRHQDALKRLHADDSSEADAKRAADDLAAVLDEATEAVAAR